MKLISYLKSKKACYGLMLESGIVDLTSKIGNDYPDLRSLLGENDFLEIIKPFANNKADVKESDITFLPVIPNPHKIICAGMNYKEKRAEFNESNNAPTLFVRFPDSQTGHLCPIIKPSISDELDYEGELAFIIGKGGFRISREDAMNHVAGYCCYMDGSIRDWQHSWFTAGKNWPSTGASGPNMTTYDEIPDPKKLEIKTFLNGKMMQHDFIANLIHSIPELIEYISRFTKLSPGDVILTGSPGGVGKKCIPPIFMKNGDIIEVEISHIGRLKNTIKDE